MYIYACYPRAGFQSFVLGADDLERPHQCTWHSTWRNSVRSWHHALHIHNTRWEFSDDKLISNMRGLHLGNSILYSKFVDENRENMKLHFCILNWTVITCARHEGERERESKASRISWYEWHSSDLLLNTRSICVYMYLNFMHRQMLHLFL